MQELDKNMLDASDKIAAINEMLSLQNEDIENVSETSQCFTFLYNFFENQCAFKFTKYIFQHPSKLKSKFTLCFRRIHQTMNRFEISSSNLPHHAFTEQEKEDCSDLTCNDSLKRENNSETRHIFELNWMTNT